YNELKKIHENYINNKNENMNDIDIEFIKSQNDIIETMLKNNSYIVTALHHNKNIYAYQTLGLWYFYNIPELIVNINIKHDDTVFVGFIFEEVKNKLLNLDFDIQSDIVTFDDFYLKKDKNNTN